MITKSRLVVGILSLAIIAALTLSTIPFTQSRNQPLNPSSISGSPVSPSSEHWYHYLGLWWDDRTIGTLCDGTPGFSYTNTPTYGNITVNNTNFDDSIVMMLNKTQAGLGVDAKFTRDLIGYWRITFSLASEALATNPGVWLVNGSTLLLGVGFSGDKIFVWDGATVEYETYTIDTWYDFDIRVSTVNDTYQVFVDDVLIEENPLSPAAGDVSVVSGIWYRCPTTATGVSYSDDFQIWGYATYEYQTDDLIYEFIDALDYVYDNLYQPGATGILNGSSVITGYEYEENMSYPRVTKGYVMDAAIRAYEITLLAKYYNMAVDIGRWLVYVSQDDDGHFPFVGGTVPNFENNVLTSLAVSESLLNLYVLTGNTVWRNSAIEAIEYHLDNSWNSTLGLFNDAPGVVYCRVNLNTAAARALAYAYYVTGDADYGLKASAILTNILTYTKIGNPVEDDPDENYSGRTYYAADITYSDWQGWGYESYSASGYAGATYYLQLAGGYEGSISTWVAALDKQMPNAFVNTPPYGMAYNVPTHEYLQCLVAFGYYNQLSDSVPMFSDAFYSMVEYCTNRAVVTLSDHPFMPGGLAVVTDDYILGACTAIGQSWSIWDLEGVGNFTQPYQLSLNSTARLLITPASGAIEIDDLTQSGTTVSWTATTTLPTELVTYQVLLADPTLGYRVYQDDVVISPGVGPSFSFTAIGGGDFEIVAWHSKSVSSLVVLTVNMVGLGIIVTVLASYIAPIANDIKEKRPIRPEKLTQNLIRTVIFIVVASLMWGVLHTIAIG